MRHVLFSIGLVLALIACLFLQGCGLVPKPKPQTILVPCKIAPVTRPDMPADHMSVTDIWEQVKTLLADRQVRQGYEVQLEAAVGSCQ